MKILLVEDDPIQRTYMKELLLGSGHSVIETDDGEPAMALLEKSAYDVVITDYKLKKINGMLLLQFIQKNAFPCKVIMLTAFSNTQDAVFAMKLGAYDYLTKPLNYDELEMILKKIAHTEELEADIEGFGNAQNTPRNFIAVSRVMLDVIEKAKKAAHSDATVLIQGESGTGKELVADLIHRESIRSQKPFVKVFCAALPENLIESELFGYKKGAFTGADKDYKGKFEYAHRGTIFLDEITEVSLAAQVKLLRVVQEKEITRLGEVTSRSIDVRIIAATNRILSEEVMQKNFREDLYYRLNVFPLTIPPLRERIDDIMPLCRYFLELSNRKYKQRIVLSSEELRILNEYTWPGNVRELENIITQVVISGSVDPIHMLTLSTVTNETLNGSEKALIEKALLTTHNNHSKAAQLLGIHRNTLIRKIKLYNIKP